MKNIITIIQNNKLIEMLNDQKVSISNVEVMEAEEVIPNLKQGSIKRRFFSFNDWYNYIYNYEKSKRITS